MTIEVLMLGAFDIQESGRSLLRGNRRANKNLELLKFFISNHEKRLSPDGIVENLWENVDQVDSRNALRAQIFRLRQLMHSAGLSGEPGDRGHPFCISSENGFYMLVLGEDCRVDTVLFESSIRQADSLRTNSTDEAICRYLEAFQLYRGDYLEESMGSEWVLPFRNRYRRLYVQSALRLFRLLETKGRYGEIVDLSEQSIVLEPMDESLHICFLEALLNLREYVVALSHYNYICGRMCRELSVEPSAAMKSIYRRLVSREQDLRRIGLSDLSADFSREDEAEGALLCDVDFFRTIYNLEGRRSLRTKQKTVLGLVTISGYLGEPYAEKLAQAVEGLKAILKSSLRRGDALAQWNDCQLIFLITDTAEDGLRLIEERIRKKFDAAVGHGSLRLDVSFQPVCSNSASMPKPEK